MGYSSMELTIRELNKRDHRWGIVERFISNRRPGRGIRSDLFGLFDLIVMTEKDVVGIQTCKRDYAAHYRKITEENACDAFRWFNRGCKIEIWDWRKLLVKRGGKARTWQPRIKAITLEDFAKFMSEKHCTNCYYFRFVRSYSVCAHRDHHKMILRPKAHCEDWILIDRKDMAGVPQKATLQESLKLAR